MCPRGDRAVDKWTRIVQTANINPHLNNREKDR